MRTYPLDVLGAESEGMIGYLLERELGNVLGDAPVASSDHADRRRRARSRVPRARRSRSARSTTPSAREALARERGWTVAPDGDDWRRVVASPTPRSIVELPTIELLLGHGVVVVCAGGGGVPVVVDSDGARHGVEAVVDKDLASALLARQLGADLLLLLTDVPAVELDWGTPRRPAAADGDPDRARGPTASRPARWARRSRPRRRSCGRRGKRAVHRRARGCRRCSSREPRDEDRQCPSLNATERRYPLR